MFKDENRHYSLRKLSVGLASVLIGISFASMTGNNVHADTVNGSNSVQTVVNDHDAAVKIDAKDDANTAESNTESALGASKKNPNAIAQDIKQKATEGNIPETIAKNATDGSQITAKNTLKGNVNADKDDSSKVAEKDGSAKNGSLTAKSNALQDTVEAAKQGLEMSSVLHSNSNETALNVNDSKVKGNQAGAGPAKSKLQMATLMTTTGKKFNTKMLSASKVVSPANDTNGGFDSSWGQLDVNQWKGSVVGDYYQLTSYTGDANHIIVPNDADFAKAGVDISGKQVGVTSDFMHTIFRDKTTAQDATVAFSKTDNKMVKAIGNAWDNTWGHTYENINGSYGTPKGKLAKFDGSNLNVSNVTNMSNMFESNQISDLTPLSNWKTDNVTNMSDMFWSNQISDLTPLSNWKTDNVTNMSYMFYHNQISDLTPLSNWKTNKVTDIHSMFDSNPIKYANLSNWTFGKLVLNTLVDSYYYCGPLYSFLPNTIIYLGNSALPDGYYQTNINHVKSNSPFNSTADHNLILTTNQEYLHTDVAQNAHNYLTFTQNGQATKVAMPVWIDATGVTADKASILNKVKSLVDAEIAKKQKELGDSYSITMDPNVDQTDPLALINASFIVAPKTTSVNVKFTDVDSNRDQDIDAVKAELAKIITLTGTVGSKIDFRQVTIPTNFELSGDLPSATFGDVDSVTIQLKHKTETSVESLPATRTINVHLPNGTTKVYQQIIGYQRDVVTDLVTKTVTHGTWTVNDVTSSFTIDGVKQLEHSYVLRNGNYNFAGIKLPKVPGYKAFIKTIPNPVNPARSLFTVSFMALPKPVTLAPNDVEPAKTVTSATTVATIEVANLIKTESKVATTPKTINLSDDIVATTPKTINLSDYIITNTPKEATWQIANEPERDTYRVSNGKYTVELPHINNTQLHVIANDSTKDSILFTYKGQNTKYVFNIKFANGHYLLTTYEIKSGKLVKLIDYNFIKSSKMSDIILDWFKL